MLDEKIDFGMPVLYSPGKQGDLIVYDHHGHELNSQEDEIATWARKAERTP